MERRIDLHEVAAEDPAESIARENEIVARIAAEDDYPEQPAEHSVREQLAGLVDPDVIRGSQGMAPSPSPAARRETGP